MPTYRDEAVVLRTHQLGEADRIISLLTMRHGKVRAVARGIRRTSSKFGARLEPFAHVDVQLATGRGPLDIVAQVETLHAGLLGNDYRRFTAAEVLVEAADRLVVEDKVPSAAQYRLLAGAVVALRRPDRRPEAVVDSYLLRSLAAAGYAVVVDACSVCGRADDTRWFSPQGGGAVCSGCRPPASALLPAEVRQHLALLITGDWNNVAAAPAGVAHRAHGMVVAFATWHLDRALRSLPFFDQEQLAHRP
ncbi:MAG: DNA repair protein RecO [Arachnia sp.]